MSGAPLEISQELIQASFDKNLSSRIEKQLSKFESEGLSEQKTEILKAILGLAISKPELFPKVLEKRARIEALFAKPITD
jgi:hypothetical protein